MSLSTECAAALLSYRYASYLRIFFVYFLADICNNYKTLQDATRKYNYVAKNKRCDNLNGWYRFKGASGTKMVRKCPQRARCDTNFPAWLSEGHPTVAAGTVTRKVCINRKEDCCYGSVFIKVKNCGSYYIYKLTSPPFCNVRYCSTD